ncbi:uncharacterized protein M437DRAFT_36009 [Aureobasidium melanogenum CBS 110374]|uniref:Uncharacterized protein n=1 Tax=Aureobasidium melanogenum (strain CBS 110374) TaxID=1043003 RepID=A0A074W2S7_AURM1|nr:uncharacterized protein M437DRAFT_36009 [Aureobasidium melanogenum CBS 110374]KEQ67420.1 hypothetical protein M437DRAFT_36009 [Aureobasidium melanogenum CBS 110374]
MTSRAMSMPARRLAASLSSPAMIRRSFQSSAPLLEVPAGAMPVRKPVGAFRGGILGFLSGAVLSGGALYYYVIDEYRVSNELLTEDIYALQSAVSRIETYVKTLEGQVRK